MTDLNEILIAFAEANYLERGADFIKRTVVYSWFDDSTKTEEQVRATPEFEGFLDGYQGHQSRYRRRIVTLEREGHLIQDIVESAEALVAAIGAQNVELSASVRKVTEEVRGFSSREGYTLQYRLGLVSRT